MNSDLIGLKTETNETLKTIYERRSVRKYKDQAVDKDFIEQVLSAGRMAPSAHNTQAWKFYILTKKETIKSFSKEITKRAIKDFLKGGPKQVIKKLSELLHFSPSVDFFTNPDPVFYGAPVVIFITAPKDYEWADHDIGMCAQNMMLAAKSLGLESCTVGMAKYVEQTKIFARLRVSALEKVHLAIILGYGNENPEARRRSKDNSFYID